MMARGSRGLGRFREDGFPGRGPISAPERMKAPSRTVHRGFTPDPLPFYPKARETTRRNVIKEDDMFRSVFAVAVGLALGAAPAMAQGMMHQTSHMAPHDTVTAAQQGWGTPCPYGQMMGTPYGRMGMMGQGTMGSGMYGRGMMGSGMYGQRMYGQGMMGSGNSGALGYPMMVGGMMGSGAWMMGGLAGPQQIISMSERLGLSAEQVSDLEDVQTRAVTAAQQAMNQATDARTRAETVLEQNPNDFDAYADALRDLSKDLTEANVVMARASFEARDLLTQEQRGTLKEILGQWGGAQGAGMMGGGMVGPTHHSGRAPNPSHH